MRSWATAVKSLPRTWLMSVAVRKSPWREVEISAPRLWDSRSWSASRAWKTQKLGWAGLRSMRQLRPSENWNWQRGVMVVLVVSVILDASFFELMRDWKCEKQIPRLRSG